MITLITGASSSGKSGIAETVSQNQAADHLFYIATMHQYDDECVRRVRRHREMRAEKGFETIEKYTGIGDINIPVNSTCLLECMSNLLANEMYDKDGAGDRADIKILSDIKKLAAKVCNLIIVTNEIFSDGAVYDEYCTAYINKLGIINRKTAAAADVVIESVAGIAVYHKGGHYAFH
jgi:adenosylcobinamide kinase/adenosylcobinamide-phosphate guanylyltransferase